MIDHIRLLIIAESSGSKEQMTKFLQAEVNVTTRVDTIADALAKLKRQRFDVAILSMDMEDFYPLETISRILHDIGSIRRIIQVSDRDIEDENSPIIPLADTGKAYNDILEILSTVPPHAPKIVARTVQMNENVDSNDSLFENAPVGLYRISSEGEFIEINRTFKDLCNMTDHTAGESSNYFSLFVNEEDVEIWKETIGREECIQGFIHPMKRTDGNTIWIRDSARPVHDNNQQVAYYDGAIEDITLQKQWEDKLSFFATQDILTGLPNRNFFQDQAKLTLSQSRYTNDLVAFLIVDIDYFSEINETYGFSAGDAILQSVAMRIKAQLRKSDLVSRLGSDKFLILLGGIRSRKDVLSVAKKIKLAFSEPFYIQGIALEVSASLGISLFPEHGEDANTLIKRAEMTVYAIKEQERGRYGIYHGGRNTP